MFATPLVLVVDDEWPVADLFTRESQRAEFRTIPPAHNLKEFHSALAEHDVGIAFVDIILRTANSLNYLRDIRRAHRQVRVIIITADSDDIGH